MDLTRPIKYNNNPITSNRKLKKFGSDFFNSIAVPLIMIALAEILVRIKTGDSLFIGSNAQVTLINFTTIARTVLLVFIASLALNTNLNSGRMDFSLGATGILSCVISSQFMPSEATPDNIIRFALVAIAIGMLLGLIHAIVLCLTKLPPIVISLGMCLVYEGIAYIIANKAWGTNSKIILKGGYAGYFFMEPIILIPLLIIVGVIMACALCYTKYGYNKLALVYNQKICVDTGINEITNCIVSFVIAGALIALYQVIECCGQQMSVSIDLASSGNVFKNFLPIFIGGLIARHNNQIVGLLLAIIGVTVLYNYGLPELLSTQTVSLLNGFSVFAVLVYMVNANSVVSWFKLRKYIRKDRYLNPVQKGE